MELARQTPARTVLKVGAAAFATLYLFVAWVAFVTTGLPAAGGAAAAYAALVPLLYAATCALWAFGPLDGRLSRPVLWALHLLALPALYFSLLGLGLLLPVLAALWWAAAGKPPLLG